MVRPERLTDTVTLYEGDCLEVLPMLGRGSVDAVVTDPPYGVNLGKTKGDGGAHGLKRLAYTGFNDTYEEFVTLVVPRINAAIQMAKRSAVFTGPHIHEQQKPDAIGGVYVPAASGRHGWGFKNFLPVLFYGKAPDLNLGAKFPTVINSNASMEPNGHPCPKPKSWMCWLIKLSSRPGETILDPFAGSGTTAIAAMKEGRRCILIERDPHYCEIIRRRVREADGAGSSSLFREVVQRENLFAGAVT